MNSSLYLLIGFIGLIMVVEVLNGLIDHSLNAYGLVPRTTSGLVGIPLSPFLHGSFLHVQSNAVGLLALGCLAVIRSRDRFPWVCLVIILLRGLGRVAGWQDQQPMSEPADWSLACLDTCWSRVCWTGASCLFSWRLLSLAYSAG